MKNFLSKLNPQINFALLCASYFIARILVQLIFNK